MLKKVFHIFIAIRPLQFPNFFNCVSGVKNFIFAFFRKIQKWPFLAKIWPNFGHLAEKQRFLHFYWNPFIRLFVLSLVAVVEKMRFGHVQIWGTIVTLLKCPVLAIFTLLFIKSRKVICLQWNFTHIWTSVILIDLFKENIENVNIWQ